MGVNWNEMNEGTPAALYTKLPINQPKVVDIAEAGVGNIQPSPPPAGTLPWAPAPQRSKETPNPYRDPSLEPAKYIRILGVKEDLQAFFGFQAFMLEQSSDPSIQIPLTRARADMGELIDIQSVMERNPGLPSRINNKQLDDIKANLRYLREILHDLEASGAVQQGALEGFTNMITEGFVESNDKETTTTGTTTGTTTESEKRATKTELEEFQTKVIVEITRLQASGTTDPVINARITTLNAIKDEVDDVLTKLESGAITPNTVPIYSSDIEKALPLLGKPTDPLPQVLKKYDLPPAIQNLFPAGLSSKDKEQAEQINNIVKGYMDNIFEGTSWGLNVNIKYDNPTIAKLKAKEAMYSAIANTTKPSDGTGLPGLDGVYDYSGYSSREYTQDSGAPDFSRTNSSYDTGLPGISFTRFFEEPTSGGLDWKERSEQIREQVRRRGLNPLDFGALPTGTVVGDDYNWRGYTKMMCMRLKATTDPGLPSSVGCPAEDWQGWKD